ncbi:MAG TPA: Gfo/Idh/MocA family oxidoreductase [Thermomicrobiales bacterium]
MPRQGETVRWGIIGRGWIAEFFAAGLRALPDAELVAVGSRRQETADEFADKLGVSRRHGSLEALANDPEVDVVYVSTPHQAHKSATLRCLAAGRPVLCEKPFAINAAEADEMIAAAHARNLFLMEAMWTRFTPLMGKVRTLLADGAIGEVRMLSADLGFRATPGRPLRLFDPAYGGGALMDVGVYVVSFASMVLGAPTRIVSMPTLGDTGVDEQAAIILGHTNGALSLLSAAIRTTTPHLATIMGTEGMIEIHFDWHKPTAFTLKLAGKEPERFDLPPHGNGYNYEAAEVMRCLRAGLKESPILPLAETRAVMQTLDEIRAQWGLRYPMENRR